MPPRQAERSAKKEQDENRVEVTIGDTTTSVRLLDVGYKVEMDLWRQSGLTVAEVISNLAEGTRAPFFYAAAVFIGRRQAGDLVSFDEIADGLTISSLDGISIDWSPGVEVDGPGEAPGSD